MAYLKQRSVELTECEEVLSTLYCTTRNQHVFARNYFNCRSQLLRRKNPISILSRLTWLQFSMTTPSFHRTGEHIAAEEIRGNILSGDVYLLQCAFSVVTIPSRTWCCLIPAKRISDSRFHSHRIQGCYTYISSLIILHC